MEQIKNAAFGVSSLAFEGFADVPTTTAAASAKQPSKVLTAGVIIILIIIVIIYIALLVATYKLTHSVLQTILCFLFGIIYLITAFIFYGFYGYKFAKK